jgi:membrane protease YdiL (CAAX protease family)
MNHLHMHPLMDFFNFARRPVAEWISAGIRQKMIILISVVALDILLSLAVTPVDLIIEAGGYKFESARTTEFDPAMALLSSVLVAPLSEEIYFRLGLAPNLLFFFISLFLSTVQYAPKLFADLFSDASLFVGANVLFYLLLSAGICLFFWMRERLGHRYADFFKRRVGWYYYLGALFFALAHFGNYAQQPPWWAIIFLVFPQLIGGLTFGYLRIRLGFWYGVLGHTLTNLLFTLGDIMNFWLGEPGGVAWFIILIILPLSVLAAPLLLSMRKRSIHTSLS